MSSWRFSLSSQRRRRATTTELSSPSGSRDDGPLNQPPRYSNVSLAEHQNLSRGVHSARQSIASLTSYLSLAPTYATSDPHSPPATASTSTLTNPPRYSGLPNIETSETYTTSGDHDQPDSSYIYPVASGRLKSKPWATLRLYDADRPTSRKKRRHPRFTDGDKMVGSVDLRLSDPQTIKGIELVLRGKIITGSSGDGSSMTFLEHTYTLWDRKFGDPRRLADIDYDPHAPSSGKYDGKMSGNWVFPFAIPFPNQLDLSTRRAVYATDLDGPVRFLPELLGGESESRISPFDIGGPPRQIRRSSVTPPTSSTHITPFDTMSPSALQEKGKSRIVPSGVVPPVSPTSFAPIESTPTSPVTPYTPSVEPFDANQPISSSQSSGDRPSKLGHSFHQRPHSIRYQFRNAAKMQNSEDPESTDIHRLPPSFLEKDVMANIHYDLVLIITHGRLSSRSRANATLIHTPISVSPPMPLARQSAYRRREAPPSPDSGLGLWKELPAASIGGTFLDQRAIAVQYKLFLALPLSYSPGTPLPCYLTITCDDVHALEVFANPLVPQVRLRRTIRFLANQEPEDASQLITPIPTSLTYESMMNYVPTRPKISSTLSNLADPKGLEQSKGRYLGSQSAIEPFMPSARQGDEENHSKPPGVCKEHDMASARWRTTLGSTQDGRTKSLYGEIQLPRGLQPSCDFPLFNILYHVELLAPATNAFVPNTGRHSPSTGKRTAQTKQPDPTSGRSGKDERMYVSQRVKITTGLRRDEPIPIAFVRGIDSAVELQVVDSNFTSA
ncbi:hypothetical protein NMY22_g16523 [Coprinellus aureogranulatus]|nr:hypothetical protein NMY22_g16523 [Coprinellus aureogranulatus]